MEEFIQNVINKIIENNEIANELINNTEFLLKYVDKVDNSFNDKVEKQIVYKQLIIITFSCIEALVKETLIFIRGKCEKCVNKNSCDYYSRNPKELSIVDSIEQLIDMRVIYLDENNMLEFNLLKDLRNNVHILNTKKEKDINNYYTYKNLNCILDFYIELIDQINMFMEFYERFNYSCIKKLDQEGIEFTRKERIHNQISTIILKLFDIDIINKQYNDFDLYERLVIKKSKKLFEYDEFIDKFNRMLEYKISFRHNLSVIEKKEIINRIKTIFNDEKIK